MALTPGADNVNTDGTHEEDVLIPTVIASLTLTVATHRRVQADPTLGSVNLNLPEGSTLTEGVVFWCCRSVTESNNVNVVPFAGDDINGSSDSIPLVGLYDSIEVMWTGTEWRIIADGTVVPSVIEVNALNDLPAAAAGVITLEDNHIYNINAHINIGTDRIELNGARLRGMTSALSSITYTDTGNMLSSTNKTVDITELLLSAASGTLFNCVDDNTHSFVLTGVVSIAYDTGGTINNFLYVSGVRCQFENAVTEGFTLLGNSDIFAFRHSIFLNNVGFAFDVSGATAIDIVNLSFINFVVPGASVGIIGATDSSNITDIFRLIDCDFFGAGTHISGMTRCDDVVFFQGNFGNSGTEDSTPTGSCYIADGDEASTVISAVDTITAIAGTYTLGGNECKFSSVGGSLLTYDGIDTITLNVAYKGLVVPASGSNKTYWLYIRKNGTTLSTQSRDEVKADSGSPAKAIGLAEVELSNGDTIEVVIENKTDGTNVTVSAFTMIAGH